MKKLITILLFSAFILSSCGKAQVQTEKKSETPSPVMNETEINSEEPFNEKVEEVVSEQTTEKTTEKLKSIYLSDAETLVQMIETRHIMFALDRQPSDYEIHKQEYLDTVSNLQYSHEFVFVSAKYLASLGDGHTLLGFGLGSILPVDWRWTDNKLVVLSGDLPKGAQVTKIGGFEVETLARESLKYRACENTSAEERQIEQYLASSAFLGYQNADFINSNEIVVDYFLDGELFSEKLTFESPENSSQIDYSNTCDYEIVDDVFIFKLYFCKQDDKWYQTVEAMKDAVKSGIKTVVVDVRNNPGGNSPASTGILDALGMEYGYGSQTVYFNEDTYEIYGDTKDDIGKIVVYEGIQKSANPKNIDFYVLVNRETFSSAMELALKTQDSKLGTIIGTTPSNSPSCYGSVQSYTLPNTTLYYQISSKWIERGDKTLPQNEIIPDIKIGFDEDAMDVFWKIYKEKK